MADKIITSISIDRNLFNYFKSKRINLSEWVNEKMGEDMNNKKQKIERLKQEIREKQGLIKEFNKEIKKDEQREEEIIKNLTKEQIEEIGESIKIIDERGDNFFEGRYNRYKNMFDNTISKETFKILLSVYAQKNN